MNFFNKYSSLITIISTIATIITVIFTAGAFYQNYKGLAAQIDKERQERQTDIAMLADRMKTVENELLVHFQEYQDNFDNLRNDLGNVQITAKTNSKKLMRFNLTIPKPLPVLNEIRSDLTSGFAAL